MTIKGTVISQENEPKLWFARKSLNCLKNLKLYIRRERYENLDEYTLKGMFSKLADEMNELSDALGSGPRIAIQLEMADVANCLDIIQMLFMDGEQ